MTIRRRRLIGRVSDDAPVHPKGEVSRSQLLESVAMIERFATIARTAIGGSAVEGLLVSRPAVVLERIARGAGATRWYQLLAVDDLSRLYERLSPGSVVSFYFDERIRRLPLNDDAVIRILEIAAAEGDAVVGRLAQDGIEIIVDYVGGPNALGEFSEEVRPEKSVFVGSFPARDDDGRDAVTITLPDSDAVTRKHPH